MLKSLERGVGSMAKFIFEMNQSLDGYVDHQKLGPPRPALFRHFIERVRGLTGFDWRGTPSGFATRAA